MATMSNEKIILSASLELMEQGILKGSGVFLPLADGSGSIELPEEIHTYNAWKAKGFQVQRGQKAVATIRIWNYGKSKKDDEEIATLTDGKITEASGHYYMKNAFFFTAAQVKPIEKRC